jgi:hypothetical protein
MKKLLIVLIALLLPIAAGAWTLPVPSGLTAGDEIYASDSSTLDRRGIYTVTPDNTAVLRSSMANVSVLLVNSTGTEFKVTETGAVAGQKVTICNISSTTFTFADESAIFYGGAPSVTQYDCFEIVYTGSYWLQTGVVSPN